MIPAQFFYSSKLYANQVISVFTEEA